MTAQFEFVKSWTTGNSKLTTFPGSNSLHWSWGNRKQRRQRRQGELYFTSEIRNCLTKVVITLYFCRWYYVESWCGFASIDGIPRLSIKRKLLWRRSQLSVRATIQINISIGSWCHTPKFRWRARTYFSLKEFLLGLSLERLILGFKICQTWSLSCKNRVRDAMKSL